MEIDTADRNRCHTGMFHTNGVSVGMRIKMKVGIGIARRQSMGSGARNRPH